MSATFQNKRKVSEIYYCPHKTGKDDSDERFVAVFKIPPVESALTAVRVSLVKEIRTQK
jgi:hypothetical protein